MLPDGTIVHDKFKYTDYSFCKCNWWDYDIESTYLEELKSVASYQGYSPEDVDELLNNGFTPEEVEEYLYCCG